MKLIAKAWKIGVQPRLPKIIILSMFALPFLMIFGSLEWHSSLMFYGIGLILGFVGLMLIAVIEYSTLKESIKKELESGKEPKHVGEKIYVEMIKDAEK